MTRIADQMKILGGMAKGAKVFDLSAARSALNAVADEAARVGPLFKAEEMDPKSEAKPEIWQDYADFEARARSLEETARTLSVSLTSSNGLPSAMEALGRDCKSCHSAYRLKK